MGYTRLFILVEGDDDERFFSAVVLPRLAGKYDHVQVWKYSRQKAAKVDSFLRSLASMGADYFFVTDLHLCPCVTQCKRSVASAHPAVSPDKVLVVRTEIESWYYAGIGNAGANALRVCCPGNTDRLTKEQFDAIVPARLGSRVAFLSQVLERYCITTAAGNNSSFRYMFARILGKPAK